MATSDSTVRDHPKDFPFFFSVPCSMYWLLTAACQLVVCVWWYISSGSQCEYGCVRAAFWKTARAGCVREGGPSKLEPALYNRLWIFTWSAWTVRHSLAALPIRWTEICPIACRLPMPYYRRRRYWWLSTWTKCKHWRKNIYWRDTICNKRNLPFSSNTIKVCKSTCFVQITMLTSIVYVMCRFGNWFEGSWI